MSLSSEQAKMLRVVFDAAIDANHVNTHAHIKRFCELTGVSVEDAAAEVESFGFYHPEGVERLRSSLGLKKVKK